MRKSSTCLCFFLPGLAGVIAGACEAGTEPDGGGAGSWARASAAKNETAIAAVQRIVVHCGRCILLVLVSLDGGASTGRCQVAQGAPVTPRPLLRLRRPRPCR